MLLHVRFMRLEFPRRFRFSSKRYTLLIIRRAASTLKLQHPLNNKYSKLSQSVCYLFIFILLLPLSTISGELKIFNKRLTYPPSQYM